jgi:hypothetical protein
MTPAELQRWFDAIREYVANAALGVCVGAALIFVAPIGVTSLVGLDHPANTGAKLAVFAAAIWIVARLCNVRIR